MVGFDQVSLRQLVSVSSSSWCFLSTFLSDSWFDFFSISLWFWETFSPTAGSVPLLLAGGFEQLSLRQLAWLLQYKHVIQKQLSLRQLAWLLIFYLVGSSKFLFDSWLGFSSISLWFQSNFLSDRWLGVSTFSWWF